jgi:hypothetical protein
MMTDRGLEITFSGSRVGDAWVDSTRTVTRATDATWTNADKIGIYMLPAGATALTNAIKSNSQYVYSSSTTTFSPAATNQTLYYPGDGTGVKFVAYYPYSSSAATANTVLYTFAGQGTKTQKEGVDFCYHLGTNSYSKTSLMTSMAFQHKFSKIRMTVNQGTSGLDLRTLTAVTLKGMPASATVNLNNLMSATTDAAVVTALGISSTTADITAYIQSPTETQAVVEAIVAPHTIPIGKTIDFTIGGETKTYTFDDALALAPGRVYDFVFTLQASGPPLTPQPDTSSFDGMTNCYMVTPGDDLTFPVKRAYTFDPTAKAGEGDHTTTLHVGGTHTGDFTASVLWDDNSVINITTSPPTVAGKGKNAVVTVQTTSNSGNAVIALKVGSDIVWSYHIWVTGYNPDNANAPEHATFTNTYNTNNNGGHFIFMDRNLGATFAGTGSGKGTGLFYQWGRKDPFPATDGQTATTVGSFSLAATSENDGTIPNTIRKPNVFYYNNNTSHNDWHWASRIDDLWYHSNNQKTIYDPCPLGWRVPAAINTAAEGNPYYNLWTKTNVTGQGLTLYQNAVYPYTGFRYSDRTTGTPGALEHVGNYAYLWNATAHNTHGSATFGNAYSNYLDFGMVRSDGASVRCVRE